MPIQHSEIDRLLRQAFPTATIYLQDTHGDQDHYSVHVISKEFLGKSRVEQHKMVYEALQGCMKQELHALSIKTSHS
ncbi:MAG: BolA family transcriptional regulator [Proteobacteria bacterium]|nr:BolA family transcriptional regulator [Pseudomonadota bacterium]